MGQNPRLPHRTIGIRFTPVSRHYAHKMRSHPRTWPRCARRSSRSSKLQWWMTRSCCRTRAGAGRRSVRQRARALRGLRHHRPDHEGSRPARRHCSPAKNARRFVSSTFRFSDCHCCGSHCLLTLTQLQCSSCYAGRFVGRKFNLERRCLSAVVSFQSLLSAASCMKIRWRLFRATCIISVSSKSWVFRNIGIWKLIGARST